MVKGDDGALRPAHHHAHVSFHLVVYSRVTRLLTLLSSALAGLQDPVFREHAQGIGRRTRPRGTSRSRKVRHQGKRKLTAFLSSFPQAIFIGFISIYTLDLVIRACKFNG